MTTLGGGDLDTWPPPIGGAGPVSTPNLVMRPCPPPCCNKASMTDHEPNSALRDQVHRGVKELTPTGPTLDAKAKAFRRWRDYLAKKEELTNALASYERGTP